MIVELLAQVHGTFWGRIPDWLYSGSTDSASLITSMTAADRQASQHDILDGYRCPLAAADGPDLDRDELWERYRQSALYAYVAALITAGMGGMQEEGIALMGLRRAVAALEDLDTVAILKKSL